MSWAPKTNQNQWLVLVDFLLEHPEMVTKSFVGLDARQNYKSLWDQAATQLNSMGFGSKTTDKWIEAFSKWKSKVKVKAQNIRLNMNRTGGGGPLPPLLPVEEKLMGIIGWTVVEGDNTTELGFGKNNAVRGQPFEDSSGQPLPELVYIERPQNLSSLLIPSTLSSSPTILVENETKNTTIDISTTPSTSSGTIFIDTETIPVEKENKKRKLTENELGNKIKAKKVFNRKDDKMTLLRMHQENIAILREISANISRVSEAILQKVNVCPRCCSRTSSES